VAVVSSWFPSFIDLFFLGALGGFSDFAILLGSQRGDSIGGLPASTSEMGKIPGAIIKNQPVFPASICDAYPKAM